MKDIFDFKKATELLRCKKCDTLFSPNEFNVNDKGSVICPRCSHKFFELVNIYSVVVIK